MLDFWKGLTPLASGHLFGLSALATRSRLHRARRRLRGVLIERAASGMPAKEEHDDDA